MGKGKKLLFSGIMVLFVYLVSELIAYAGYGLSAGELFSWTQFDEIRQKIIRDYESQKSHYDPQPQDGTVAKRGRKEVIHPYLGYVIDSQNEECSDYGFCDWRVVGAKHSPVTPPSADKFVVGIFGGSFAGGVSAANTEGYLDQELRKIPQLLGKEIVIHTVALGGYKQPQQLMALNYFLMLGAHFDLVINIDGFNEVALPPFENLSMQVFPSYPRRWFGRVRKIDDIEGRALFGEIAYHQKQQSKWAQKFSNSSLRYSVIANLIWLYQNSRYVRWISTAQDRYASFQAAGKIKARYVSHGPRFEYSSAEEVYGHLARVWSRSSLQMAAVSRGLGIEYLHFLQPNQYVKGSKPMGPEEYEAAIIEGHPYREGVEQGYPFLIKEGEWLRERGVNFHDLTMMFADNEEVLYRDKCCHVNTRGYDLVVQRILQEIRKLYPPLQ